VVLPFLAFDLDAEAARFRVLAPVSVGNPANIETMTRSMRIAETGLRLWSRLNITIYHPDETVLALM
jgi:hypothetical protein